MLPLFSYYSVLLFVCYYSMATRKTRRIRKTKGRKGGNDVTQFARRHGMWSYASTKQAALDIANLYDKLENPGRRLSNGEFKGKVLHILRQNFGPIGNFRANIVKELKKIIQSDDPNDVPEHIYLAIQDVQDTNEFDITRR